MDLCRFSFVFCFLCGVHARIEQTTEVCTGEDLKLQCPEGEIILMTQASFGRMSLGRCLENDFGFLGCKTNVLPKLDSICTGKNACFLRRPSKVDFDEMNVGDNQCIEGLEYYLSTKHSCVAGMSLGGGCLHSEAITMGSSPKFLFSGDIISPECLRHRTTSDVTIFLKASPGQQINVSLIDFRSSPTDLETGCIQYGSVLDQKTSQENRICGGFRRESWVMTSNSNQVKVNLRANQNGIFLLNVQAVGCPDLNTAPNVWMTRDGRALTVGCNNSKQTWHLVCEGNTWIGVIGNCTTESPKTAELGQNHYNSLPISPEVWLALIVSCCLIACVATITFGVVCWKRRLVKPGEPQLKTAPSQYISVPDQRRPNNEHAQYIYNSFQPLPTANNLVETEDSVYDFVFRSDTNTQPAAQSSTLPGRGTIHKYQRGVSRSEEEPESPKYKTLVLMNT